MLPSRERLDGGPEPRWHLCCMCGSITPEFSWTYWQPNCDEATEQETPWVPHTDGEEPPMCRCPVCRWEHRDTDDGSGFYAGTWAEMNQQRTEDAPDFSGQWEYTLREAVSGE